MISDTITKRPGKPGARLNLTLLVSASFLGGVPAVVSTPALAQSAGVDALVQQAKYWRSKGREDLAQQALRRARAIDPNNAALKAANAPAPAAKPVAAKPAPAPKPVAAKPAARPAAKPAPAAQRPAPTKPQPVAQAPAPRPAAPAPTSSANRAGQARVSGFDALNDGNLASAEAQFQRALSINRRDPDALGGLGLVRLRQSNFAQAADYLEQASHLGNASQWAKGLASAKFFAGLADARTTFSQGRMGDAQTQVEALVRSGYDEPGPALELLADIYEKQGRYADAADLYRQAGQGGGADEKRLQLRAARGRALAAADRGDDMGAIREFQNGLVIDARDPWIRYEFAEFMIKRGRVPEAESLLLSLVNNGGSDSLYAAALINNDLKRPGEAERLISLIPEAQRTQQMRNLSISVKTDNAITRARAMARTGQQEQALGALRQLGSMAAVPAGKQAAVASALFDLGDSAGALQVAQAALDGQITSLDDYEGLISVLARAGRDDLAQQALARAGQLAGTTADGQRAYGRMSAALMVSQADNARLAGRYAESFDVLQSAYSAAPDNPDIMMGLARLYQSGGMAGKAAQTFQLVLARRPGDKDALLGLADTAQAAGDRQLSEQAQKQVLQQYPSDYQVRLTLANVERARGNNRAATGFLKDARELYMRGQGGTAVAGANPFAGMGAPGGSANPFRNQQAAPAPQPVNPFSLGGGARLPSAYPVQQQGYAAQQSYGTSPGVYAPAPQQAPQQTYAAPVATGYTQSATAWGTSAPMAQGGGFGSAAPLATGAVYGGDPVMAQIQTEIASMAGDSGPRVDVETGYRQRSGEAGLSRLNEIKGSAKISTGVARGRIYAKAEAIVADAGTASTASLRRFGQNATEDAIALADVVNSSSSDAIKCVSQTQAAYAAAYATAVANEMPLPADLPAGSVGYNPGCLAGAGVQQASGVALTVGYESDFLQAEAGTTPIGMGKTKFQGRLAVTPKLGQNMRATAFVEQRPVTDSVLSYAGARNPVSRAAVTQGADGIVVGERDLVTGERWGQVMRGAAGLGLSYDREGSGVYVDGRYYRFRGTNTVNNSGIEANMGGYLRVYRAEHSNVTVGLNVNYQTYDKSQNYFTYGNGGYFSPQSFISVGFPVSYTMDDGPIQVRANFTPGFQSYREEESPLYPTDAALQAGLDILKDANSEVRSHFDSVSKTGFALQAGGSVYYKVGDNTRVGGDVSYNTFGSYTEFRSVLGVRQSIGSSK